MQYREGTALALIAGLVLSGCATMQEKRWGTCAVVGGLLGAGVGASAAGVTVHEYEGGNGGSTTETAIAAASGAVGGAVVGTLLGHLICDPQKETPPPPPPPPPPAPKKISLSGDAHFDFDSAKLRPTGEARIDELVDGLKANPSLTVMVAGHTDSIGSDEYNQRLSEARANAVRDYMVSLGISPSRISTHGYGETDPVASNDTEEGRAQNRRVDITTK
jgi:OOP family OmpA-OmpF porin